MLTEALLVAVWAFFCGIDKYDVALNIHRPLITGPVVGLIMGDLQLGLITGATLELAWLGLVPNAGAQPPDVTMGTIAAVAFAVMTGQSAEVAMGVGMPIAVLMQMLIIGFFAVTSFTMGKADEYAEQANPNGLDFLLISTISLRGPIHYINQPYTRLYDLDLYNELRRDNIASRVVCLTAQAGVEGEDVIEVEGFSNAPDYALLFPYIVFAQINSFYSSFSRGITTDNPCPTGEVNRVVQGVIIHPFNS